MVTIAPEVSCGGAILANEAGMVLVGNEANLLAIGFFGHVAQAEAVGNAANFLLPVIAHRKLQPGQDLGPDSPQHIRLVLARIEPPAKGEAAVGRLYQPGVVPRGDLPGADAIGVVDQLAEFQPRIADDARVGRPPGRVLGNKVMDNAAEFLLEIDRIERDSQSLGDASGVGRVACAAATLFPRGSGGRGRAGCRFLAAMAHEQPDHLVTGLAEQPGGHAAIDSAGHG